MSDEQRIIFSHVRVSIWRYMNELSHKRVGSAKVKVMRFPAHVASSCLKGRFCETWGCLLTT
jgi:hypothetical protein